MSDTPTLEESLERTSKLTTEEGNKIPEDTPEESEPEAKEVKEPKPEKVEEKEPEVVEKPKKSEKPDTEVKEEEQPKESKKKKVTLDHIDPNEVPEELKPWYDKIMSGFTKGRQKDREAVKKLEKQIKESKPESESKPEEPPQFDTPEEYYTWQAKKTAEEVVKTERQESFKNEALNYYNASDPRLNQDSPDHDPIIDALIGSQLDEKLEAHVKENGQEQGFDYKSHIKQLLEEWDQYQEGRIKNYISRQNKITKEKAKEFKKKAPAKPNPAKTTFNKKLSLQEALQAAAEKTK